MDVREEMALRALDARMTVTEVARMYGVSRVTVRLWRDRYREGGRAGLIERCHAPQTCPHKTSEQIEQLIVADRLAFRFGSKKILQRLAHAPPSETAVSDPL